MENGTTLTRLYRFFNRPIRWWDADGRERVVEALGAMASRLSY